MRYVKKYLGIDWGEKRIGLAMADSSAKLAVPFKVVHNVSDIKQCVEEENIDIVVLGKPIKMSGDDKLSDEFVKFTKLLNESLNIPIKIIDERLSSKQADSLIGDKKIKAPRDAIAAMLILQNYLDKYGRNL